MPSGGRCERRASIVAAVRIGRAQGLIAVLGASLVSMLGSSASFVAVPWFVLSTTGSVATTGLVSAATAAGVVISGLVFGPLLDGVGLRAMAVAADLVAAVAIGSIPLLHAQLGAVPMWAVAALTFTASAAGMVSSTARQSLLPALSAEAGAELPRVSAAYWAMQRATLVLAAAPVGILIATIGPLGVLWVDSATFVLASAILLVGLRTPGVSGEEDGYLDRLRAGLGFIRGDHLIRVVLVVAMLLTALEAPLLPVIVPSLAASDGGPGMLSRLVLAYAGGMLAGAIGYGLAAPRVPKQGFTVACLTIIGLGCLVLAWPAAQDWYPAALIVMGVATGPLAPLIVSTVQQRTPPPMVGRVTGALISSIMAAIPLSRAVSGYAIDTAGMGMFLGVSAASYFGCAGFILVSRRLRQSLAS